MEADMVFIPTGSPTVNKRSSSLEHQFGSTETLQPTPIVFVVDEDLAIRQSLEILIGTLGWNVETFACAEDFLVCSRSTVPCCLILDVSLPDISGLELQARIGSERKKMPIIFLAAGSDIATTVRAMKAGAFEFFVKPLHDEILVSAIREALEASRTALAKEAERQALQRCFATLSRREREVMALVSAGLLNKEVGGELGISEITVKAHRGQVMQKMQANSFADLVIMATSLGLDRHLLRRHWLTELAAS
jgi:FixJ family two-component response regulator